MSDQGSPRALPAKRATFTEYRGRSFSTGGDADAASHASSGGTRFLIDGRDSSFGTRTARSLPVDEPVTASTSGESFSSLHRYSPSYFDGPIRMNDCNSTINGLDHDNGRGEDANKMRDSSPKDNASGNSRRLSSASTCKSISQGSLLERFSPVLRESASFEAAREAMASPASSLALPDALDIEREQSEPCSSTTATKSNIQWRVFPTIPPPRPPNTTPRAIESGYHHTSTLTNIPLSPIPMATRPRPLQSTPFSSRPRGRGRRPNLAFGMNTRTLILLMLAAALTVGVVLALSLTRPSGVPLMGAVLGFALALMGIVVYYLVKSNSVD